MNRDNTKFIVKAGIIAAIYTVLTVILGQFSYGPLQFRISEAMTILPIFETAAIPGLAIGCLFANFFSGYGFVDIFFGSLTTLLAAYLSKCI
jgi:uncharacterized membrane protein